MFKTDLSRVRSLRFGLVSYAMYAQKWDIVSEELRKIILKQALQTDPLRLLAACLLLNNASANTLSSANLQKFILRQIKLLDKRVVDVRAGRGESHQPEENEDEDEEEFLSFKPSKMNPHFFSFYGSGLLASKSYQPSICECQLSLARTWLTHAQTISYEHKKQRQTICSITSCAALRIYIERCKDRPTIVSIRFHRLWRSSIAIASCEVDLLSKSNTIWVESSIISVSRHLPCVTLLNR